MANLNELEEHELADEAMLWAVEAEFEMRHRRYELAKKGIGMVYHVNRATESMKRLSEAFAGIGETADVEA